jgi:hypothetical protein
VRIRDVLSDNAKNYNVSVLLVGTRMPGPPKASADIRSARRSSLLRSVPLQAADHELRQPLAEVPSTS